MHPNYSRFWGLAEMTFLMKITPAGNTESMYRYTPTASAGPARGILGAVVLPPQQFRHLGEIRQATLARHQQPH
jgi:hypothetical protein